MLPNLAGLSLRCPPCGVVPTGETRNRFRVFLPGVNLKDGQPEPEIDEDDKECKICFVPFAHPASGFKARDGPPAEFQSELDELYKARPLDRAAIADKQKQLDEAIEFALPILRTAEIERFQVELLLPGCGHQFHVQCLQGWINAPDPEEGVPQEGDSREQCPICRAPLDAEIWRKLSTDPRRNKRARMESLDSENDNVPPSDNDDDDVAPLWEDNSNEVYIPTSPPPGSGGFDVEALTPAQQVAQSYVASLRTWVLGVLLTSATWRDESLFFRGIFDRYDEQHDLSYTISNLQVVSSHDVSQFYDAAVELVGGEAYTFNDDYESSVYKRWEELIGKIYDHYVNTNRALDAVKRHNEGASLADRVDKTVIDLARYKLKRLLMVALDNDKLPAGYRPFNYAVDEIYGPLDGTSEDDDDLHLVLIPAM
jgi:hypothetical protein